MWSNGGSITTPGGKSNNILPRQYNNDIIWEALSYFSIPHQCLTVRHSRQQPDAWAEGCCWLWRANNIVFGYIFNPLSPHDALKHHFTSLKTYLIFLQPRVLERKFPWDWSTNTWQFSSIFKPHPIIFIHYKSRIATAIRGLWWMKMTMVNSGLKGLSFVMIKWYFIIAETFGRMTHLLLGADQAIGPYKIYQIQFIQWYVVILWDNPIVYHNIVSWKF